jgi:hypothetical protein
MSKYLLFCRTHHPDGWGSSSGYAHGYVFVAVEQLPVSNEKAIIDFMASGSFKGNTNSFAYADGMLSEWYGGQFDLVGKAEGTLKAFPGSNIGLKGRFFSIGDNRFSGSYSEAEILREKAIYDDRMTLVNQATKDRIYAKQEADKDQEKAILDSQHNYGKISTPAVTEPKAQK